MLKDSLGSSRLVFRVLFPHRWALFLAAFVVLGQGCNLSDCDTLRNSGYELLGSLVLTRPVVDAATQTQICPPGSNLESWGEMVTLPGGKQVPKRVNLCREVRDCPIGKRTNGAGRVTVYAGCIDTASLTAKCYLKNL